MSADAFFAPTAAELFASAELRAFHGIEVRSNRYLRRGKASLFGGRLSVHPLDAITIACDGDPHAELERTKAWHVQNAHHRLDIITDRLADDSLLDQDIIDEVEQRREMNDRIAAIGISLRHFGEQMRLYDAWRRQNNPWVQPLHTSVHDTGKAVDL